MSDNDLVSIGMPVYNGEEYIEGAIEANLAQSYANLELIISDNASDDRTEAICRHFESCDSRVRYIRNKTNIGAAQNYNQLFDAAKGKYFRWSNADDLPLPDLVQRMVSVLQAQPGVVIAYGQTELIGSAGEPLGIYEDGMNILSDSAVDRYRQYYQRIRLTNIIYGLMRASSVAKTRKMGNGKLPAGDINFMAAMILQGKFMEVPEVLFQRRMHEQAFSSNPDSDLELQFWTGGQSKVMFPNWRMAIADAGAIVRSPTGVGEKIALLVHAAKRAYWQRDALKHDLSDALAQKRQLPK